MRALWGAFLALGLLCGAAHATTITHEVLSFSDLEGWEGDDHESALKVFLDTCGDIKGPDWRALCALAHDQRDAKAFFELFFRPVLVRDGQPAKFTGYFEPELDGSRVQTERFRYPVYRQPREAKLSNPWLTRRDIETTGVLTGRGLEIAWVDDPVELFFLQIQGSGRIRLPDGSHIRVGYGGSNGHDYRSIGVEMARRGYLSIHQASATTIRNWVKSNPDRGREVLHHNPSYVFFREIRDVSPEEGPKGAMNRSITARRSVAIDPKYVPLGAPVWIEKNGANPMRRLMVAQDTGSVIKGAQRADIFMGTGDAAGQDAATMKDGGRMVVLMPIQRAYALLPEWVQ